MNADSRASELSAALNYGLRLVRQEDAAARAADFEESVGDLSAYEVRLAAMSPEEYDAEVARALRAYAVPS